MVTRKGAEGVPENLGVVVAVIVHEAGCHHAPIGFDHPPGRPIEPAQLDDLSPSHSDVTVKGGAS